MFVSHIPAFKLEAESRKPARNPKFRIVGNELMKSGWDSVDVGLESHCEMLFVTLVSSTTKDCYSFSDTVFFSQSVFVLTKVA